MQQKIMAIPISIILGASLLCIARLKMDIEKNLLNFKL